MRAPLVVLVLLLAVGLLAGCQNDGITTAAATTYQPAHADDPVPPPVGPTGLSARRYDRDCCEPRSACPPAPRTSPIGEVYAGVQAAALPAWGGGVEFGQVFSRTSLATWSFEGDAAWQDLDNVIRGSSSGEMAQVRGSVKASFFPCGRHHATARAGVGWFRTTGHTNCIGDAADYFAFHARVGYELDVTRQFTTGPELMAVFAAREKGFDILVVPQLRWHFIWKF